MASDEFKFEDSWENHKLQEVEQVIKQVINDIQAKTYEIIKFDIDGRLNRAYDKDLSQSITVTFTAYRIVEGGNEYDGDYSISAGPSKDNMIVVATPPTSGMEKTTTPDLREYIKNHSDNQGNCYINIEYEGKSKNIIFKKYAAYLSIPNNRMQYYNTTSIPFDFSFTDGTVAELNIKVDDDEEGIYVLPLTDGSANLDWTIPSDLSPDVPHVIEAYISLNKDVLLSNSVKAQFIKNVSGTTITYNLQKIPKVSEIFPLNFKVYLADNSIEENDTFAAELYECYELNNSIHRNEKAISKVIISKEKESVFNIDVSSIKNIYRIIIPEQKSDFGKDISAGQTDIIFYADTTNISWSIKQDYVAAWEANNGSYALLDDNRRWYSKEGTKQRAQGEEYFIELPFKNVFGAYGFAKEYLDNQSLPLGDEGNYLTLGHNYRIATNFYPFYNTYNAGILETGGTFSITFRKRTAANGIFYICNDSNFIFSIIHNELKIQIGGQNLYQEEYTTSDKSGTNYNLIPNGEKINIIITIDSIRSERGRYISVYINGELSARVLHAETSLILNTQQSFLNDNFSDNFLDIYNIYYYDYCFTDLQCLAHANLVNKTVNNAGVSSVITKFADNNFYDSNGDITLSNAINYGKYVAKTNRGSDFAVVACTDFRTDTPTSGESRHNTSQYNRTDRQVFCLYKFKQDQFHQGIIDDDIENIEGKSESYINALKTKIKNKESLTDEEKNLVFFKTFIIAGEEGDTIRIRRQGTTTRLEPTANIRIDIIKTGNKVRYYRWDSTANKFVFFKYVNKGDKLWHIKNVHPFTLLTMKHNPNESTQSRNLPTSRWYEECSRAIAKLAVSNGTGSLNRDYLRVLTPPQIKECGDNITSSEINNLKMRQAIDGIPGIGFEFTEPIGSSGIDNLDDILANPETISNKFAGQYDLITDKANMDVFGFGYDESEEDYSIEFRNNDSALLNFRAAFNQEGQSENMPDTQNGDSDESNASLEYRYPDEPTNVGSIGLRSNDPLPRLFEFVIDCNDATSDIPIKIYDDDLEEFIQRSGNKLESILTQIGFENASQITPNEESESSDEYGTFKTYERTDRYRYLKFRCELANYVVVPQFCLNGLLIEWGLLIDQDTKNQFFTHFKGDYKYEYDSQTEDYIPNLSKPVLRLLAYDMDTSWGADNDSYISHNPWELYEDGLYDGKVAKGDNRNGSLGLGNGFWPLVYKCFAYEIDEIAKALQEDRGGKLLTTEVLNDLFFTKHINVYNELIYNSNAIFSYVNVPVGDNVEKRKALLKKIHGSDKFTTKTFILERCSFLQGKYFTTQGSVDYMQNKFQFTLYNYTGDDTALSNKINASRTYLAQTIAKRKHYRKGDTGNGEDRWVRIYSAQEIPTSSGVSLIDKYDGDSNAISKMTAPKAICIFNTQSKEANIRARGWYHYVDNTEGSGNLRVRDRHFLDYVEKARENNIDYYPSITMLYNQNGINTRTWAEGTGFMLTNNSENISGTGSSEATFTVYGPYFETGNIKPFQIHYLHKEGLIHDINWTPEDGEEEDYILIDSDVDGLFSLGPKNIYSLIDNQMDSFGPSNVTGILHGLESIPANAYLGSYQYSNYVKSDTLFANNLRLYIPYFTPDPTPNAGNRITLDLRKPVFCFNANDVITTKKQSGTTGGGLKFVNKIYCYAQALKVLNPENIITNNFDLCPVHLLPLDIEVLDFRYNYGEATPLNNSAKQINATNGHSVHPGYPSSVWALSPFVYLQRFAPSQNIIPDHLYELYPNLKLTQFRWINGTRNEPVLAHSYLNHANSNCLDFYIGKYIKIEDGAFVDAKDSLEEGDEGYKLFDWEDDAMIAALPYHTSRSKEVTLYMFAMLQVLYSKYNDGQMADLTIQGYLKWNKDIDPSEQEAFTSMMTWLHEHFPDFHVIGKNGENLTQNDTFGTEYF